MKRLVDCPACGFRYAEGEEEHDCPKLKEAVLRKAIKVINSSESRGQIAVASRFARLACDMFPELYNPLREVLTRLECNISRVQRGDLPWPLIRFDRYMI